MISKLFGRRASSETLPDAAHLERLLAEIALGMPQIEWVALVKSNGIFLSSFPSKPEMEADRISAMSAAMSSLGERIASELNDGNMQYTLIAGTDKISVTIELRPDYLLTIGLKGDVSLEGFLSQMQEVSIPSLMKVLHSESVPRLSGVQRK